MKTVIIKKTVKLIDDWNKLTEDGKFKLNKVLHEKLCKEFDKKYSKVMTLKCGIVNKSIEQNFYVQLQISGILDGLYHPQNRNIERFYKKYKQIILKDKKGKTIEKRAYEYAVKCLYFFNNKTNTHRILAVLIAEKAILDKVVRIIKNTNCDKLIISNYQKEINEKRRLIKSYKEDLGEVFIESNFY